MNRSLIALWVALAAAIFTIAAFAQFWIAQRERSAVTRVQELLSTQLAPVNQAIQRVTDAFAVELERNIASTDLSNPNACVELKRSPLIRMLVVFDSQQQMLFFPRALGNATLEDRALIDEAQQVVRDYYPRTPQLMQRVANDATQVALPQQLAIPVQSTSKYSSAQRQIPAQQPATELSTATLDNAIAYPKSNWVTWYHRRGLMIGYIWQQDTRWQAVAVLPRTRWIADIVSALADVAASETSTLAPSGKGLRSLRQLVDVEGKVVHQWSSLPQSAWSEMAQREPDAEVAVGAPLEGWRLREFASDDYRRSLAGDDQRAPIWLAVCGLSASLVMTGLLVTLNVNRQIRLAQQRVSFVNQVSHELRTPLTNICMYADLVAQALEHDEA